MASPTPRRTPTPSPPLPPDIIDPRWLLKALAGAVLVAAICAYLSVCLLVYQGGWQSFLHPSPTITQTPSIPFESVNFDSAETGTPRLTAWYVPADPNASAAPAPTILFLHDGTGSLSDALPTLELLHRANLNVFAIDYRGYGKSQGPHPTELRMAADSEAALTFLENTRHLPPSQIIPYGVGLGASLATTLAATHPQLPAVILDQPDPNLYARVAGETRTRLLPMHLLLQEHFDIAKNLPTLNTPKLLLAYPSPNAHDLETLFHSAKDPKLTVTFGQIHAEDAYISTLHRFLDEYVPPPPLPPLLPAR